MRAKYDCYKIFINCPADECKARYEMRAKRPMVVPYKSALNYIELISQFSYKQSEIEPDLELDSLNLTTEEFVDKFKEYFGYSHS